ncbi:MAG: hypothetical protein JWQ43_745, partial [Glaciihabitans sp.]|nr:hypothetical protein [Glaciihabitans sp.]
RGRKNGGIAVIASMALLIGGASWGVAAAGPSVTPAPTAAFTDQAPVDPPTVSEPSEDAAVAIGDAAATAATAGTAVALLATLPVKGRAPKTGYDREAMFGTAWLDVDRNGCDTRNDILARDLVALTMAGVCKVMAGTLLSPYTAQQVDFVRGNDTSALVQIDHLVALSNAWQTGAQQLSQGQRETLANDPINLLAVDGRSNSQKGDGDAATWLPANTAVRCSYVARQISVKATYGLWVTQAEHNAMANILAKCPDEPALTSKFTPVEGNQADVAPAVPVDKPAPTADPVPAAQPAPTEPAPAAPAEPTVVYANCEAVRAAGAAPLYADQPGYSSKLDRDGDGVGCDT